MASKISVVINTLNEAKNLPRAISSVKNFADEIIVVDMESEDGTVDVAKKLGAKVFRHQKVGYVEPARNFAIGKAVNNWILVLDADEEIPVSLAREIQKILKSPMADYYRISRKNIIFGKWIEHTLWWPDYQTRLFKKGAVSWNEIIHTVPVTVGKGSDIEAIEDLAILHHNYDLVEQYLDRLNRYSSVQANLLIKEGYKFEWKDLVSRPLKEFINRYFAGSGYKDGLHGLSLSLLQAFSELVVYLKVWQSTKFKEQNIDLKDVAELLDQKEKETRFWMADARYKATGNVLDRIRRKFKI